MPYLGHGPVHSQWSPALLSAPRSFVLNGVLWPMCTACTDVSSGDDEEDSYEDEEDYSEESAEQDG